mgnify:CR=1 FL=1
MAHPLYPLFVHFPIALLITSVLFDVIAKWHKRDSFREGAFWLLILGLAGGVTATIAGSWAEEAAEKADIAESLMETHETLALVTLSIFGVQLLGRLSLKNQFTANTFPPYFLIALVGLGTLSATGYFGGTLVYEHGAGVSLAHKTVGYLAKHPRQ